jgi:hypothetical protein
MSSTRIQYFNRIYFLNRITRSPLKTEEEKEILIIENFYTTSQTKKKKMYNISKKSPQKEMNKQNVYNKHGGK